MHFSEDIELYSGPRFKIAKEVCEAIFTALEAMKEEDKFRSDSQAIKKQNVLSDFFWIKLSLS